MELFFGCDTKFAIILGYSYVIGTPYSVPLAFLPPLAKKVGLDEAQIGLMLGIYAVGLFFTSMWAGQNMQNMNKKKFLNYSMCLLISGLVLFSILIVISDPIIFEIIGLIARLIQGASVGLTACILYSLLPIYYPETLQKKLAMYQLSSGVATGLGPFFGSFFAYLAGFSFAFLATAAIIVAFVLTLRKYDIFQEFEDKCKALNAGEENTPYAVVEKRPDVGEENKPCAGEEKRTDAGEKKRLDDGEEKRLEVGEETTSNAGEEKSPDTVERKTVEAKSEVASEKLSFSAMLKHPRMIFTFLLFTATDTCISIYSPTLSIFVLETYGMTHNGVSILLALNLLFYTLPTFFSDQILSEKYDRRTYIIMGFICQSVGLIWIAGSFFVGQHLVFLVLGMCLLGFGTFSCTLPGVPEFIDIMKEISPMEKGELISDYAAGLANSLWGLAEFIGPILGGTLAKNYSFPRAMEIYSYLMWILLLTYLTLGRGFEGLKKSYESFKNRKDLQGPYTQMNDKNENNDSPSSGV